MIFDLEIASERLLDKNQNFSATFISFLLSTSKQGLGEDLLIPVLAPLETVCLCRMLSSISIYPGRSLGAPEGTQLHDHI